MPTPVAHSIVSLALSEGERPIEAQRVKWLAFWVVLGNFPDLDFLPGLLVGDPSRFHHGFTHSLLFTSVLALAAYGLYAKVFEGRRPRFLIFLGVAFSHLLLDTLTLDTAPPFGLPLFWPFRSHCFSFPIPLFLNVNRAMDFRVLLSGHNFLAIFLEVAVTLPMFLWAWIRRGRIKGGKGKRVASPLGVRSGPANTARNV